MRGNVSASPEPRASRRRVVGALALAGTGLAMDFGSRQATAATQDESTPDAEENGDVEDAVGRATAPEWSVTVVVLQDPYPGQIQAPENPPAGVRFVAAEMVIDNASSQALAFTPADIRLVDAAGTEYRGGAAAGAEPFLGVRNLNGGDRSRGWVWFMVPNATELTELVYVAPTPLFRIALE